MKILNLYAGIGGNRKLWGDEHEVTAVEYKPEIAKIYSHFFPNDTMVVGDAHQYLLEHYDEFDFIWASPPCPSHSRVRFANQEQNKPIYPEMSLYQEIIFLQHYFKGKFCVENVIAFYPPLIPPNEIADHWFWTNFILRDFVGEGRGMGQVSSIEILSKLKGFDLSGHKGIDKTKALRNCVEPELAKHILDLAINPIQMQANIFA